MLLFPRFFGKSLAYLSLIFSNFSLKLKLMGCICQLFSPELL